MNIKKIARKIKRKVSRFTQRPKKYELYSYLDENGNFDYELYKDIQDAGNKRKLDRSWATEEDMIFLSSQIRRHVAKPNFGICHGTRRGLEQQWLSENLHDIKIIGTDIADSATDFPNTIQWDFHEEKPEWVGKADFVYSNSFDHSYDPKKSLSTWMRSLKPDGICILQHAAIDHSPESVNELDPFGANLDILPYLILTWSEGNYSVREIIPSPDVKNGKNSCFLIIKNNE